jgi:hypothetical protein
MSKDPTDFYDWLRSLSNNNVHYFLEGGQAVNIWAYKYVEENTKLRDYFPFTSKDCDICIDSDAFKRISTILNGSFIRSNSPSAGQLGMIISEDNDLTLDLLSNVFGLNLDELRRVENRVMEIQDIKIIDPLYLFKGKCHNLVNLPQTDRNDRKHVLMLSLIIPEYLNSFLKALHEDTHLNPRELIKEIKLLLNFQKDHCVRRVMESLDITFKNMIPLDHLSTSKSDLICKYTENSLLPLFRM